MDKFMRSYLKASLLLSLIFTSPAVRAGEVIAIDVGHSRELKGSCSNISLKQFSSVIHQILNGVSFD